MQFFSTRDTSRHVTSSEAIVQGLSGWTIRPWRPPSSRNT